MCFARSATITNKLLKKKSYKIYRDETLGSFSCLLQNIFHHTLAEVPLSLPAPIRECGIFGTGMMKNHVHNMGIKRATTEHVFAMMVASGLTNSLPPLLCNIRLYFNYFEKYWAFVIRKIYSYRDRLLCC